MIKIIFKKQLLLLMCCVMVFGCVTSCKKDTGENSGKVELLSFGPSGAKHGEQLTFIGNNLNKVTAIDLVGVSISASGFISQTSEKIVIYLPRTAEEGLVTLKTPDGDLISKTLLNFTVTPVINFVTPLVRRAGENITIQGDFVNWITGVIFAKDTLVTTIVSKSLTEIVFTVPINAQTGKLTFVTGGSIPLTILSDIVLVVTLPTITSFTPSPILHETSLTITGTNLDLTKGLLFTGLATPVTSFESKSATQIVVKVPSAASNGKISLVAYSGLIVPSSQNLTLTLPSATTLAPNPIDPGGNLTITGANLNLVTGVSFKGVTAPVTSFISQSATQIVVKVPAGTNRGKVTLSVLHSLLTVESIESLLFVGDLPNLAPLAYAMYEDDFVNNWQDWGWSRTGDYKNTENVRDGVASIKLTYTGNWGGMKLANSSVATAAYSELTFSIFGTIGTNGKVIHVQPSGGTGYIVTIQEGKWVEYKIPFAQVGSPATISELMFQNESWTGTVYVDHIGLR